MDTKLESEDGHAQIAGSTAGSAVNISITSENIKKIAATAILICFMLVQLVVLSVAGAYALNASWSADKANMHAELAQNYAVELEGWMKEHGLHPPADPWQPKEKRNARP